ncbi:TPA: hypothetical protein ACLBJ0_001406 [Neisseria meningitidis]
MTYRELVERQLAVRHADLELGLSRAREQEPFVIHVSDLLDKAGIKEELHAVKLSYHTKADAKADSTNIAAALERIENKLEKVNEKLDRKADKS